MPTGSGDIQTAVVVVAIVVNIPSAPLGLGCASPVSGLFFFSPLPHANKSHGWIGFCIFASFRLRFQPGSRRDDSNDCGSC